MPSEWRLTFLYPLLFSRILGTLSYCNPLQPAPSTQGGAAQTLGETVFRTLVISLKNIHSTRVFKIQRERDLQDSEKFISWS